VDLAIVVQPELSDSRGRPDPDYRGLLTPDPSLSFQDSVRLIPEHCPAEAASPCAPTSPSRGYVP